MLRQHFTDCNVAKGNAQKKSIPTTQPPPIADPAPFVIADRIIPTTQWLLIKLKTILIFFLIKLCFVFLFFGYYLAD